MVKTYIAQWLYTFPWSQVVSGFWQKFPNPYTYEFLSNPIVVFFKYSFYIRGHVLSEDTYYRIVTDDQKLISKRLLAKTNKLPRWGERVFSRGGTSTIGFIIEESVCDLKQKIFTTSTININLKSLMVK
jgi:hypothetical protein